MKQYAAPEPDSNTGKKNIALFTANYRGGILQFTMQVAAVLSRMGHRVSVFIPDKAAEEVREHQPYAQVLYKSFKSVTPGNRYCRAAAAQVLKTNPDLVLFSDDTIMSAQTLEALGGRAKTALSIHDVLPHIEGFDPYVFLKQRLEKRFRSRALRRSDLAVLYSSNSYDLFLSRHGRYRDKAFWMPLGAHIPDVQPKKPPELGVENAGGYTLFFGRISKYKGIVNLLRAYDAIGQKERPFLIIAGSGAFQPEEARLLNDNPDILPIVRFIGDDEMLYLIKNARAVVLPYIEASQSGVIPIAYYYGVPVITSDVDGLKEFVQDGVTGLVTSGVTELKEALLKVQDPALRAALSEGAGKYGRERLSWTVNLERLLGAVFKGDGQ